MTSVHLTGPKRGKVARDPFLGPRRKNRPNVKSLSRKVRKIQGMIELKEKDLFAVGNIITPTLVPFSIIGAIALGTGNGGRMGTDIRATSIQWRVCFNKNATAAATVPKIRMMIFWDQQCNGADPAIASVLDLTTVTVPTLAPYNSVNQKRFKILFDKLFTLTSGSAVGDELTNTIVFRGKRKLSRVVKYATGAGGSVASLNTNNLVCLLVSDAAANSPTSDIGFRFIYQDI